MFAGLSEDSDTNFTDDDDDDDWRYHRDGRLQPRECLDVLLEHGWNDKSQLDVLLNEIKKLTVIGYQQLGVALGRWHCAAKIPMKSLSEGKPMCSLENWTLARHKPESAPGRS